MLLRPLRSYLAFIQSIHGSGDQCGESYLGVILPVFALIKFISLDEMALAALEMNLERVDSVLA
jgi:hypothetical protein